MQPSTNARARPAAALRRLSRRALAGLVLALGVLAASGAHATAIDDMHDGTAAVADQGEAERERGFRTALEEVIVRMTGSGGAIGHPEVRDLLGDPGRYVQSFRYRALDDDERERIAAREDMDELPSHELEVAFSGSRLEEDLRARDVPVWGERRPELLLWIGVDDGRDRYIVGEEDGEDARQALVARAERRGLPLLLPLLDLEDRDRVDFIDIRGPFLDAIERASARYGADTRLVGYISRRSDEEWVGEWTLTDGDRETDWRLRAPDRDSLLAAGVDGATDRIAAAAAGRTGERLALAVHVGAVTALSDYVRVAEYLDGLARVARAEPVQLAGNSVRFELDFEGSLAELRRTIATSTLLDPAVSSELAAELAPTPEPVTAPGRILTLDELVSGLAADAARLAADADDADDEEYPGTTERIRLHYRLAS